VAVAAGLTPLNSTMIAVALPEMAAQFGAPAASVTVSVVTGYLIATVVCQMPAGSVADRVGYGRALTLGRWIFAGGALAAVLAPGLTVVVMGRLFMAAAGALMVPTAMALIRVAVPPERRPRAFGAMGAVMAGSAAAGPAIGALLMARLGWRALFLVNLPLLLCSRLLQPASLATAHPRSAATRPFDWPGTTLLGAALVLIIAATRSPVPLAYGLGGLGLLLFAALVIHERRAQAPILDLALFTRPAFAAGASVIALQNLAMYSLLVLVPFLFAPGGGSSRLGLAIVAMTATMAVTAPVGGWLAERVGLKTVVTAGGLLGAFGVAALTRLAAEASIAEIGSRLLFVGLGIGLSTGPSQAGALGAVDPRQSGMASAAVSMLRYLGAIGGTVILALALSGGEPAGGGRYGGAMWTFVAAFLISSACALGLGGRPGHPRNP
jgi:MFS family permease